MAWFCWIGAGSGAGAAASSLVSAARSGRMLKGGTSAGGFTGDPCAADTGSVTGLTGPSGTGPQMPPQSEEFSAVSPAGAGGAGAAGLDGEDAASEAEEAYAWGVDEEGAEGGEGTGDAVGCEGAGRVKGSATASDGVSLPFCARAARSASRTDAAPWPEDSPS